MPRRNPPTVAPSRPAYGGPQVMGPGQGMLPLGPRDDVMGSFGTGQRGQGPDLPPDVGPFEQTGTDIMNLFNTGTTAPHWSDRQMSQMYGLPLYKLFGNRGRGQAGTAIGSAEIDRMYRNVSGGLGYYGGQLLPNMFGGSAGGPQPVNPGGPGMLPLGPQLRGDPGPWDHLPSPWGDWNAQPSTPGFDPDYYPQPQDPHGPGGVPGFAQGGDFLTNGPQMIMVGDNPGGVERVQVDPMAGPPGLLGPDLGPGPGGYSPGPGYGGPTVPPAGISQGAQDQFDQGNPFDALDEYYQGIPGAPQGRGGPAGPNPALIRMNVQKIRRWLRGRNKAPNLGPVKPMI